MGQVKTISIRRDTSIEMAEEYILKEIKSIREEDSVVLDMGMIHMTTAKNIPLLIIVSYLAYAKTHKFVRLANVSPALRQYLTQIGFWNMSHISRLGYVDKQKNSVRRSESIVLPITCVENVQRMNDIFIVFRQNQSKTLSYKLKTMIGQILNLLGENCFDHSGLGNELGFYVYIEENEHLITMTVLDMGMGFYNSLSRRYPDIGSDAEAISRVLLENISCRDENGGCGYFRISSLIDQYAGRIMVRSGDAIVHYSAGEIKHTEETVETITGCCVVVELDKQTL